MVCPECGVESYLMVDGEYMSEAELNALPHAPKKIEMKLNHSMTCTKIKDNIHMREPPCIQ